MTSVFPMHNTMCPVCNGAHAMHTKCSHDLLLHRIESLISVTKTIPELLKRNKELVEISKTMEVIAIDASKAISIAEETCMEFDNGKEIWGKFQERLAKAWDKARLSQDTERQQLELEEKSTLSETENRQCILVTENGEPIV